MVFPRDSVAHVGASETHYQGADIALQEPGFTTLNEGSGTTTVLFQKINISLLRYYSSLKYKDPNSSSVKNVASFINSTFSLMQPKGVQKDTCYNTVRFILPCDLMSQFFINSTGQLQATSKLPLFNGSVPDIVSPQQRQVVFYLNKATDNTNSNCNNITFTQPQDCSFDKNSWQFDLSGPIGSIDDFYNNLKAASVYSDQVTSMQMTKPLNTTPTRQGDTLVIQRPVELVGQDNNQLAFSSSALSSPNPLISVGQGGVLIFRGQNIVTSAMSAVNTSLSCLVDGKRYPNAGKGCYRMDLGFPVTWNVSLPYCQVVVQDSQVYTPSCDALDGFRAYTGQAPNSSAANPESMQQQTPIVQLNSGGDNQTIKIEFMRMEGFCVINSNFTCAPSPVVPSNLKADDQINNSVGQWNRFGYFLATNSSGGKSSPMKHQAFWSWGRWVLLAVGIFVFVKVVVGHIFYFFARHMKKQVREAQQINSKSIDASKLQKDGSSIRSSEKIRAAQFPNSMNQSESSSDKSQSHTNSAHQNILRKIQSLVDEIRMQKLQILEKIGQGAFGIVYKGVWNHEQVAVKEILLGQGSKEVESAVLEAAITTSIQHVNLVQCKAYSLQTIPAQPAPIPEDDQQDMNEHNSINLDQNKATSVNTQDIFKLYLIQEYCDLGPLTSQLRKRAFYNTAKQQPNLYVLSSIALDIAQGCNHIHHNNVIHGDLKSNNVLLKTAENQLGMTSKITDFGLSVRLSEQQSVVSGHMAGTPFYVAPEVIAQGQISKKSDVFSFGVLLWELFNSQVVYMNNKDNAEIFPQFSPTCPMGFVFLTGLCISPMPDDRPSFDQIVDVLRVMKNSVAKGGIRSGEHNSEENMGFADKSTPVTFAKVRDWTKNQDGATSKTSGTNNNIPQVEQSGNSIPQVDSGTNVAMQSNNMQDGGSTKSVVVKSPEGDINVVADFNGSNPAYSRSHVKLQSHGKSYSYTTIQQMFIRDSMRFDSSSFHTANPNSNQQYIKGHNPSNNNSLRVSKKLGNYPVIPRSSGLNMEQNQESQDKDDQIDKQPLELTVVYDKDTKKIDFFWRMVNFTPSQMSTSDSQNVEEAKTVN